MKPTNSFDKKLKAYGTMAGTLLAMGQSTEGAIIYTDIPDVSLFSNGSTYNLDLNNDLITDFTLTVFNYYYYSGVTLSSPNANNQTLFNFSGTFYGYYGGNSPLALNQNDNISSTQTNWSSATLNLAYSGYAYSWGNWLNQTDKYLGLRFEIGGQVHYGWARLDVIGSGFVTIKDYAYEDIVGAGIQAGVIPPSSVSADTATNVMAADIGDNLNGTDAEYSFTKAVDETTIDEYRVMVVKTINAGSFDLTAAQAVVAANYTAVTPTGSNITGTLAALANDVDGDPVINNVPYTVFVLSIADGTVATLDALSGSTASLVLTSAAGEASNISTTDIGDNVNGSDLEVSFNMAANESLISEYRVMVVKTPNAGFFDLAAANLVSSANYSIVNPNGSNQTITLGPGANDVDGDAITNNQAYEVFILSVADGVIATINALSSTSGSAFLTTIPLAPTNVTGTDIGDNNNGTDLEVSFTNASNEAPIGNYAILVVKSANAGGFTLTSADGAITAGNFTSATTTGSPITTALGAGAVDVDGDAIVNGQPYVIFVVSVADGTIAIVNALSNPSPEVTLNTVASTTTGVTAADVSDLGNGEDLQVTFDRAADETTLDFYRVIVVKAGDAATFDLAAANAVAAPDYLEIDPTAVTGDPIVTLMGGTATDKDGDLIVEQVPYRVFILSIANGTSANINSLSTQSNEITLDFSSGVNELLQNNLSITSFGSEVRISAEDIPDFRNAQIKVYNTTGQVIHQSAMNDSRKEFNLNGATGVYFVTVEWNGSLATEKVFLR